MEVTPIAAAGRQVIEAYGPGHFRVSGIEYGTSVIVTPERTVPWRDIAAADFDLERFSAVMAAEPAVDVLLIGCGARIAPLPKAVRDGLREAGIGADTMDTGAACRTFNVLVSEGRRVAAALIAL